MKLLVWDTSSKTGTIAAMEDRPEGGRLISEWSLNVETVHSERLLWGINQVLDSASWSLADVDCFGVGLGPGSFTGLRIGITTGRTLAESLDKPIVGVSSLATLAQPIALLSRSFLQFQNPSSEVLVITATDACKGEFYAFWGLSEAVQRCVVSNDAAEKSLWDFQVQEKVLSPEELLGHLTEIFKSFEASGRQLFWCLTGDTKDRYPEIWNQLPQASKIDFQLPFGDVIQGKYLALQARKALHANLQISPLDLVPHYLRASSAELKLQQGKLPPGPTRK